jgi:polyhydroxyalkanoate synthesis regulator phasin
MADNKYKQLADATLITVTGLAAADDSSLTVDELYSKGLITKTNVRSLVEEIVSGGEGKEDEPSNESSNEPSNEPSNDNDNAEGE